MCIRDRYFIARFETSLRYTKDCRWSKSSSKTSGIFEPTVRIDFHKTDRIFHVRAGKSVNGLQRRRLITQNYSAHQRVPSFTIIQRVELMNTQII